LKTDKIHKGREGKGGKLFDKRTKTKKDPEKALQRC